MGYKVFLKVEPDQEPILVHEFKDRRVKRVGLSGTQGEAGALGVAPSDSQCVISFEYAPQTGTPTLEDLEALTHPSELSGSDVDGRIDRLSSLPTATNGAGVEPGPFDTPNDVNFGGLGDPTDSQGD